MSLIQKQLQNKQRKGTLTKREARVLQEDLVVIQMENVPPSSYIKIKTTIEQRQLQGIATKMDIKRLDFINFNI